MVPHLPHIPTYMKPGNNILPNSAASSNLVYRKIEHAIITKYLIENVSAYHRYGTFKCQVQHFYAKNIERMQNIFLLLQAYFSHI